MQFDRYQPKIEKMLDTKFNIVHLNISQFIALAMGADPYKVIGVQTHTVPVEPLLEKIKLNPVIWKMVLDAPLIARRAKAGQFVIVKIDEKAERIPLTINDCDFAKGTGQLAKTDAMLLLTVVAAMGSLAWVYLSWQRGEDPVHPPWSWPAIF